MGTKEIQREGFEYELTVNFTIDRDNHLALASKDRTKLFIDLDPFIITTEIGEELAKWNEGGAVNVNELKKQVIYHLNERLDIDLPKDKVDLAEFVKSAIFKLTEIEYAEANLPAIVEVLKNIEDKEWAKKVAWGDPVEQAKEEKEDLAAAI